MNQYPELDSWETFTASLSEARPLLTSFEVLEGNVDQQLRQSKVLILALLAALLVVLTPFMITSLQRPTFEGYGIALSLVLLFGLASTTAQLFQLIACRRNIDSVSRMLRSEIHQADYVLDASQSLGEGLQ